MPCSSAESSVVGTKTSVAGTDDTLSDVDPSNTNYRPCTKKPRYACTFHPNSNTFSWAKVSRKGPSYAFCTICSRDISVAYGGTKDLHKHEQTAVHQGGSRSVASTLPLTTFFNKPGPRRMESVVEAEVKFVFFVGEHHLAFSIADHCSKLFSSLFPDSPIVRRFKCGRTKATAILKVIADEVMIGLLSRLQQSGFFSLHTDESTDITVFQQCAIMLRFFDNTDGVVRCIFFKLIPLSRADSASLFKAIDQNFSHDGAVCYGNLVGLGSDGANVMLGTRNSVLVQLKAKQPALVSFHCNFHVAALIANHACKV